MPGPWQGGLTVRGLEKGRLPVVGLLCAACLHHRRVTGRRLVVDFLNSQPIETHRDQCPATKENP